MKLLALGKHRPCRVQDSGFPDSVGREAALLCFITITHRKQSLSRDFQAKVLLPTSTRSAANLGFSISQIPDSLLYYGPTQKLYTAHRVRLRLLQTVGVYQSIG